jgi:predicted Zn-dependent protease
VPADRFSVLDPEGIGGNTVAHVVFDEIGPYLRILGHVPGDITIFTDVRTYELTVEDGTAIS